METTIGNELTARRSRGTNIRRSAERRPQCQALTNPSTRATQLLLLSALSLSLVSCLPILSGRVNTVSLASPPQQPMFIVISRDSVSFRERMIVGLIEKKMSERGFVKASSAEKANVTVQYNYSIGPSKTDVTVSSSPDYVYGGKTFRLHPRRDILARSRSTSWTTRSQRFRVRSR